MKIIYKKKSLRRMPALRVLRKAPEVFGVIASGVEQSRFDKNL
jgi:hypothetical protein